MLYENYHNRIEKIAAFLKKVVYHLPKIIVCFSVVFVTVTTLLATKGIVGATACPEQVVYGDSFDCFAKAFLSDVMKYEYRAEGSEEWSGEVPKYPGRYYVRGVSEGSFGGERHGKESAFEIIPRLIDVNVVESQIEYGKTPSVSAPTVYGDVIKCEQYLYADIGLETTDVTAINEAIKVYSNDGRDVTSAYRFTPITSPITFGKIGVTVTVDSTSKVYDATPLRFDTYQLTEGELIDGDVLQAVFDDSITDTGSVVNTPVLTVINKDGTDVSIHYVINEVFGTLTVDKRPVIIHTGSIEEVYNAANVSCPEIRVDETTPIVEGQSTEIVTFAEKKDVGSYDNTIAVKLLDAEGRDVTENYSLIFKRGTIKITPKDVTVTGSDGSFMYDGTDHKAEEFTFDGAVEGHTGSIINSAAIKYVGSMENQIAVSFFEDDLDVTKNYNITYVFGTLEVTPRPVTLLTASNKWMYDGEAHKDGEYTVTSELGLAEGDVLTITDSTSVTTVGSAKNEAIEYTVYNGDVDVKLNYEVTFEQGDIEICKRPVTFVPAYAEYMYDGMSHNGGAIKVSENSDNKLVDGHKAVGDTVGERTEVGASDTSLENVKIFDGETEMTSNYEVILDISSVVITPRPVIVQSADDWKYYDGTPLTNHNVYTTEDTPNQLVEGHYAKANVTGSQTEVAPPVPNKMDASSVRIYDGQKKDVTHNYDISCREGYLEVKYRAIFDIIVSSDKKMYDDTPLTNNTYTLSFTEGEIPEEHKLIVNVVGSITDVGMEINTATAKIVDKNGKDVTIQYKITIIDGVLEVTPRPVTIQSADDEKYYDGYPLTNYNCYTSPESENELVKSHTATAQIVGFIIDIGKTPNTLIPNTVRIYSGGRDVTHNYVITEKEGTLEIKPYAIIQLTTASAQKEYDGTPLTSREYEAIFLEGELGPGHSLYVSPYGSQTEVGKSENPAIFYVSDRYGRDITKGYIINPIWGELEVLEKVDHGPAEIPSNELMGKIKTSRAGTIYLKQTAYGSYSGIATQWNEPPRYTKLMPNGLPYSYLTSVALEKAGGALADCEIAEFVDRYMLPYYTGFDGNYVRPNNDSVNDGLYRDYTTTYYSLPENLSSYFDLRGKLDGDYAKGELDYRQYVHDTYMDVDPKTRSYLQNIIREQGFSIYDNEVLGKVADYVQHAAKYNLEYDTDLDYEENMVIAFLEEYGEGVCRHYATTGVFLFRTLGLPARYVTGYMVNVKEADTWTEVRQPGHAWVEVYLDGVGWVEVEVTGGGPGGGGGGGEMEPQAVGKIKTGQNGTIYLKNKAYGNYSGLDTTWHEASRYTKLLPNGLPYSYLTSVALKNAGGTRLDCEIAELQVFYMLPYYTGFEGNYVRPNNDSVNDGEYQNYTSDYYTLPSNMTSYFDLAGNLDEKYASLELEYRKYVHSTYMNVDARTKAYLETVIKEEGFSLDDKEVLEKVASFIQHSAEYNLEYDRALDEESNVVIAFLDEYKEGVCRHYATAATLLFRTLGLPARYVTGFMVKELKAGEWTDIMTPGHAWVEVYLDGIGWVMVEVTGGGEGGLGTGDGDGEFGEGPIKLDLTPIFKVKTYDGTPLYADNTLNMTQELSSLLAQGYTYEVLITGSQTEVGKGESTIEKFTLYDPNGTDITASCEITYFPGVLEVLPEDHGIIRIYLYQLQKIYDGKPLIFADDEYEILEMDDGLKLNVKIKISLTNVGDVSLNTLNTDIGKYITYEVYDANGKNVTANCSLFCDTFESTPNTYVPLKIDPRAIKIVPGSSEKKYDGTPLTNDQAYIVAGSLAEGDKITYSVVGSITEIGSAINEIDRVVISNANGDNVTLNYAIEAVPGTLTIIDPDD